MRFGHPWRRVGPTASSGRRIFVLAAVLLTAGARGDGGNEPPGYVSETLPNGLEVSILPDPAAPIVATQVWYHVGSANEQPGQRGLAHLFEHLMFGRTTHHEKTVYWDFHHRHGGSENAYTSEDETVYLSEIAPQEHLGVIDLEADRMVNLVPDPENLENEKKIVNEEFRMRAENNPEIRVLVAAQKAILDDHPYAVDPSGTKEDVSAATLAECFDFYERYYRPDNAHLVISGPVDARSTLDAVERAFGPIPGGGRTPPDVPALLGFEYPEEVDLREDLPPVKTAVIGFPLPPADATDAAAVEVLVQMLSRGAVDPFREEIVARRHKAVVAGTEVIEFRRGGAVVFYAASLPYRRKRTAFRLMEEARARLGRLDWLTEETLASAKKALERQQLEGDYYTASRARAIGMARWWEGDERKAFDRLDRLNAVTRDQVATVFRRYVMEPRPVRLYVVPERIPILVRLFGWLYPLVSR